MIEFVFGLDSKLAKNLSSGSYFERVPVVAYKGEFALFHSDWNRISDALKSAESKIRVSLDFSECRMEEESDESEKENPCWYLPYDTFVSVDSISEIHFPEGLTAIGSNSFSGCKNLRAVFFPKNTVVHSIGHNSFSGNPSLEEVHLYQFDGALGECFKECGAKEAGESGFGQIAAVEMPAHPIFLEGYGQGYYQFAFGKTNVGKIIAGKKEFTLEEWVDFCRPMKPKTGIVKESFASSELDEKSGKYAAKNVSDARWTSWVEGSAGDGSGEEITLFLSEPTTISYLCVKNGFGNLAYFWSNNRAKEITVILDGDEKTAQKHTLSDTPFAQYIHLQKFDKLYSKITLKIESVYKGTDGEDDCAIDEIGVNAGIARREVYGGFYDTDSIPYIYDGETQRMLKGLYALDVGEENVRVSKDGFVQVRAVDWENGEKYWTQPSGAFSGTLYSGFFPGTGGGHSYDCFRIFLNPNGSHFLFIWHDEYYGVFELYPPNLKIYAWKNSEWERQTEENHDSSLNEIFDAILFVENRNLSYDFYIDEDENDGATINVYPKNGALELPVPLIFSYDEKNGVFLPYKKTILTELAFGTKESISSLGDWKNQYEKIDENYPIQIFCYPACFNQNASVVRFLQESGFRVENSYKTQSGKEEPYKFNALEAWQAGENTAEVRAALINAGAEYSPEMLILAIEQDNIESFQNLAPLVKDYEKVLEHLQYKIGTIDDEKIKIYFKTLFEQGVDLNRTRDYGDRYVSHFATPMNRAIQSGSIDLVKFFLSIGVSVPKLDDYFEQTPLEATAKKYLESSKSRDYEKTRGDENYAQKYAIEANSARKMLDFLFSIGISADEKDGAGENMLHEIAKAGNGIDKYHLEIARLFILHGANANQVGNHGTALQILIEESSWDEREWNENKTEFKNLLLENGAATEYAVWALFKRFEANELLENSALKEKFDFYLSKCTGKLVSADSSAHPQKNKTKSLIVHFLEQCYEDGGAGDEILLRLLDAGFGLEGMVDYNGENDPFMFYADRNSWNLSGKKGEIAKRFLCVRPDSAISLDKMLYSVIKNPIGSFHDDALFEKAKFLIESGASWQYTENEKINDVNVKNTAWLLLAVDERYFAFGPYEYNEDRYYDDDYKYKFEEKKMTADELEYFDGRASPYIKTAKLLIKKGAGEILTKKAFKKAKVPKRVYKRIFE